MLHRRLQHPFFMAINRQVFWTPTRLLQLKLWSTAQKPVYQDTALTVPALVTGDPVGGWPDQSHLNNHLLQSTGAKRPVLLLATLNGQAGITFNGTSTLLAVASLVHGIGTGNFWLAGLGRIGGGNAYRTLMAFDTYAPAVYARVAIPPFIPSLYFGGNRDFGLRLTTQQPTVYQIWRNGTTVYGRFNGVTDGITFTINTNIPTGSFQVGSDTTTGSDSWQTEIFEIVVASQAPSLTDLVSMDSYLIGVWGLNSLNVLVDGDSNALSLGATAGNEWLTQVWNLYGGKVIKSNYAVSGSQFSDLMLEAPNYADLAVNSQRRKNLLITNCGTNDLVIGGVDSATLLTRIGDWQTARRAAGLKVPVLTISDRNDFTAPQRTQWNAANTAIRASSALTTDGLIDIAASALGTYSSANFANAVHWNNAGCTIVAGLVKAWLDTQ